MYPDIKDIILKGAFYLGENKIYRLLKIDNNHKKTHIVLTTPLVILSNYCIDKHYLMINIDHLKTTGKCTGLNRFITVLERELQKHHSILIGKSNLSVIHTWKGNQFLRFNLSSNKINIYDKDKDKISIDNITRGSLIKVMFWLKGININDSYWNLQLEITQIRLFDIIPPTQCLINTDDIIDNATNHNNCDNYHDTNHDMNHDNYDSDNIETLKYNKMLKMGIPIESVRQKCILDGLDPDIILSNNKNLNNSTSNKNSLNINKSNLPNRVNLLAGLGSVSLKKVTKQNKNNILKTKSTNTNQLVPSLDDILAMKQNLKQVNR